MSDLVFGETHKIDRMRWFAKIGSVKTCLSDFSEISRYKIFVLKARVRHAEEPRGKWSKNLSPREPVRLDEVMQADTT